MTKENPISPFPAIVELLKAITENELKDHVAYLAATSDRHALHPKSVERTLSHLTETLKSLGYEISEERYGSDVGDVNLLVERKGEETPDEIFELGAHFDTVPGSPGADDNGSGVAGVLAIAGLLSKLRLQSTIRLCIFGGEEVGLLGSRHHVLNGLNGPGTVRGAVVFEMIGFRTTEPDSQRTPIRIPVLFSPPTTGDFIAVVADWQSRHLASSFVATAKTYVPELATFSVPPQGELLKDASRSDHLPYWETKRPALMLTDTANFRNPNYHLPSDLPETLDYEFMGQVTRATAAMLLEWASLLP